MYFSETSVDFDRTTRRYISEDRILELITKFTLILIVKRLVLFLHLLKKCVGANFIMIYKTLLMGMNVLTIA
jgi:hypothetical protein